MGGTFAAQGKYVRGTANERLKERFGAWMWGAVAGAAVVHFLVLSFFPEMSAADYSIRPGAIEQIEVPPQLEIPPPPEAIQRPQVPLMSTNVDLPDDLTIPPVTFDRQPVETLPAPPGGRGVDVSEQPVFTPYEVRPELRDRSGFQRLLERRYPVMLREAGIGGTVLLWVFVDEGGSVRSTRVVQSSGYEQLDEAARAVMAEARFSPALNRDQRVPVWIQIPVTFQTR